MALMVRERASGLLLASLRMGTDTTLRITECLWFVYIGTREVGLSLWSVVHNR